MMERGFSAYLACFQLFTSISVTVNAQFITLSSDLDCDFETPCRWRNGTDPEDNVQWGIGSSVVLDSWHSIPRAKDGPGDIFTYVQGSLATVTPQMALLISSPIPCQSGKGELTFWYWKTSNLPTLEICIRQPPGIVGTIQCVDSITGIHRQEWSIRITEFPGNDQPFEIIFRATFNYNFDILAIDEIRYSAEICDSPTATVKKKKQPSLKEKVEKNDQNHSIFRRGVIYQRDRTLKTQLRILRPQHLIQEPVRHIPEPVRQIPQPVPLIQKPVRSHFFRQKDAKALIDDNEVDYYISAIDGFRRPLIGRFPPKIITEEKENSTKLRKSSDAKSSKKNENQISKNKKRPLLIVAKNIPGYIEQESNDVDYIEIPKSSNGLNSAAFDIPKVPLFFEAATLATTTLSTFTTTATTSTSTTTATTTTPSTTIPSTTTTIQSLWKITDPFALSLPLAGPGAPPVRFDLLNFMRQVAPLVPQIVPPQPKISDDGAIYQYLDPENFLPVASTSIDGILGPWEPTPLVLDSSESNRYAFSAAEFQQVLSSGLEENKIYGVNVAPNGYQTVKPPLQLQTQGFHFPRQPLSPRNIYVGYAPGQLPPAFGHFPQPSPFFPPKEEDPERRPLPNEPVPLAGEAQGLCPAVDCNFDGSQLCLFRTGAGRTGLRLPPGTIERGWRVSDRQVSNSLTGIYSDKSGNGMFAYAGLTDERADFFVMSSDPFTTQLPSRLSFYFYLAGIEGRLRLCINDFTNCPFENLGKDIKLDSRKWRKVSIPMDPGTKSIHFVVDNLKKNYVVGVDEVELVDESDRSLTPCF